jgi:hypothetical protein
MKEAVIGVVAGAVVGIVAAAIGAWAVLRARRPPEAKLELVDVGAVRGRDDSPRGAPAEETDPDLVTMSGEEVHGFVGRRHLTPTLDIKLRNPGGQAAFVKRMVLEISEAHVLPRVQLPQIGHHGTASEIPSWVYDVRLPAPPGDGPSQVSHDLSQVVPSGGVDRFRVRLYADREGDAVLYRMRVRLLYNGQDHDVVSEPLAVALPSAPFMRSPLAIYNALLSFRKAAEHTAAREGELDSRYVASLEDGYRDPEVAMRRFLDEEENRLRMLVGIADGAVLLDPGLADAVEKAKFTLARLEPVREELFGSDQSD